MPERLWDNPDPEYPEQHPEGTGLRIVALEAELAASQAEAARLAAAVNAWSAAYYTPTKVYLEKLGPDAEPIDEFRAWHAVLSRAREEAEAAAAATPAESRERWQRLEAVAEAVRAQRAHLATAETSEPDGPGWQEWMHAFHQRMHEHDRAIDAALAALDGQEGRDG